MINDFESENYEMELSSYLSRQSK